jgi:hypothetical protein
MSDEITDVEHHEEQYDVLHPDMVLSRKRFE